MSAAKVEVPLLYLWRPGPVVTIGRHQNPWKECVLSKLEEDGVGLVRRRSGGGAIFQDQGGTVFTFISPSGKFNIDQNLEIVLGGLRRCGVSAEKKGRNDLTFEGRKISGSAFKHAPDRGVSLHHGTVLIDADFGALQKYLTPDKRKLQAKGIASVGARVMNLKDEFASLTHGDVWDALIAEFREVHGVGSVEVEELHKDSPMALDPAFQPFYDEVNNAEWRFGRTPDFSHKMDTRIDGVAVFDVQMDVHAGKVKEAVIFSDALYPDVITAVVDALAGVQYGRKGIGAALDGLRPSFPEEGPRTCLDALTTWMLENVDD